MTKMGEWLPYFATGEQFADIDFLDEFGGRDFQIGMNDRISYGGWIYGLLLFCQFMNLAHVFNLIWL